jgi:hypothetical protein
MASSTNLVRIVLCDGSKLRYSEGMRFAARRRLCVNRCSSVDAHIALIPHHKTVK